MPHLSALSLALNRPGAVSLEQVVASLFAAGEQGAWYDPSAANVTWRRNLLRYTEELDNAAWTKSNALISANAVLAPNLTLTADKLIAAIGAGGSLQHQAILSVSGISIGTNYTCSVYLKKAEYTWAALYVTNIAVGRFIDLTKSGPSAVGAVFANAPISTTVTSVGDDWLRVEMVVFSGTNTNVEFRLYLASSNGSSLSVGDDTSGFYVWGAQLEANTTTATPYQRIVTPEITYLADVQSQPLLFQDSTGATPVTAVEQPVGLILDKRKGLVLGPELVTNGDFSGGSTSWSLGATTTVTGGAAVSTATPSGSNILQQNLQPGAGKWVKLSFNVSAWSGGNLRIFINNDIVVLTGANGSFSAHILSTSSSGSGLLIRADGTAFTGTIDNISVKLLDGNHAYQTGSAARPVLRARYNLLTYSEQFDNTSGWGKFSLSTTANSTLAPDGTTTADTLTVTNTTVSNNIYQGVTVAINTAYTYSVYVKAGTSSFAHVYVNNGNNYAAATFELSGAGLVTKSGNSSFTIGTPTITPVQGASGWYRCVLPFQSTLTNPFCVVGIAETGTPTYNATGGVTNTQLQTLIVWGADLRVGTSAGDYQRIAAATDYATTSTITGQPFRPYIAFDGTDDGLITAGFAGTTMDFFQGHYHDRSKTTGQVIQFDMGGAYFGPTVESGGASAAYTLLGSPTFRNNGADETLSNRGDAWTKLTGTPKVLGTQSVALSPWTLTNLCSYPSSPTFNPKINLFGCIIRQSLTASQRASVETYLASKTGVTL